MQVNRHKLLAASCPNLENSSRTSEEKKRLVVRDKLDIRISLFIRQQCYLYGTYLMPDGPEILLLAFPLFCLVATSLILRLKESFQ